MNNNSVVMNIDALEPGELISSLSIMMGVSFDYTTSPEGAVKFKNYNILKEYESELTKSVVDAIENPHHPFLDVWYESEECFVATVANMIAERNECVNSAKPKKDDKAIAIGESLDRIELFDDSNELSEKLRGIADSGDGLNEEDKYFLKECAENIEGMYSLLEDIKKEIGS